MHTTVHLSDIGVRRIPGVRRTRPDAGTSGLRYAVIATPAPLATVGPRPIFGRLVHVAFWDDADAAESGLAGTAWSPDVFDGVRIDAEPVRAIGAWPGLSDDLPVAADSVHHGPSFVMTIGRLRLLQAHRFLAASAPAERQIVASPGLTWGYGAAAPERRIVMTVSWWHDFEAMATAVRGPGGHVEAMGRQAKKDFHHESAFIRFRPIAVSGSLGGKHAIPELSI